MADKEYYYLDINLIDKRVVGWGVAASASLTGNTDELSIHRVFLTKGQYNKLVRKLNLLK